MSRFLVLLVFLLVVLGGGLAIGYFFQPGEWYAGLQKPSFTPPDIVFAYVWPVLYVLVAVAGWRVFIGETGGSAWTLWLVNIVLNFLYTPLAFGENLLGWSTVVVFAALLASIAFIRSTWHRERLAAVCFIPYALWLGYAATLSTALWWGNGGTVTPLLTG